MRADTYIALAMCPAQLTFQSSPPSFPTVTVIISNRIMQQRAVKYLAQVPIARLEQIE